MELSTAIAMISAAAAVSGIIAAWVGYARGAKKDATQAGEADGTIKTDIQYIKRRTDDVLLEQRDTNKSLVALSERVTRVEESAKQAHKRIDELKEEK